MYLAPQSKRSCARAWLEASRAIESTGEGYNVVVDVEDPVTFDEGDNAVITLVDSFLRCKNQSPVATVANTIFPQELHRRFGAPAFYAKYWAFYDSLTTNSRNANSRRWGRYFERITRHRTLDGKLYYPLQELIDKLREQGKGRRYKATHELAVYDPLIDRRYTRGGQCLSFLSFKLHPQLGLALTAIYRNQTYVTRLLGNLIGLGRLQAFVATEAGLQVAWLTCISTHAKLDTGEGWGVADVRKLLALASERFE